MRILMSHIPRTLAAVACLTMSVLALSSAGSPAHATPIAPIHDAAIDQVETDDAVKCGLASGPPGSTVCIAVEGSGTFVDVVRISRSKTAANVCDYQGTVSGTLSGGGHHSQTTPMTYGCSPGVAWVDVQVYRRFADRTELCGSWTDRSGYAGRACTEIKA